MSLNAYYIHGPTMVMFVPRPSMKSNDYCQKYFVFVMYVQKHMKFNEELKLKK